MKSLLLAILSTLLISTPVLADERPVPIRGEIASFELPLLKVVGRNNETYEVHLEKDFQIVGVEARKLDDIKIGDFVSSTAVPNGTGGFEALQISILPEALAGSNEGQHPWDVAPDSVMTNATISNVIAKSGNGQNVLTLSYDGDKTFEISLTNNTPIVGFIPGSEDLLQPGAEVFIVAAKNKEGLVTNRVIAETKGIKPPM